MSIQTERDEQTRQWLHQYFQLRTPMTDVEWIMFKGGCSRAEAQKRIASADPAARIREEHRG